MGSGVETGTGQYLDEPHSHRTDENTKSSGLRAEL
jgi:hypothetical protein